MPVGCGFILITINNAVFLIHRVFEAIKMISADLGAKLESYVQQLVASGRYGSKSEVLREGVRLIQDREARLMALDATIAAGLEDVDAGRIKSADEVFERLAKKYGA
jgi:antitoxin ParD1/3/4